MAGGGGGDAVGGVEQDLLERAGQVAVPQQGGGGGQRVAGDADPGHVTGAGRAGEPDHAGRGPAMTVGPVSTAAGRLAVAAKASTSGRRPREWPRCAASEVRIVRLVLDPLALPPLPRLQGERVVLRRTRDSDVDDWLRHPVGPEEADGYDSSWRREWDGRRYGTREQLVTRWTPRPELGRYAWMVEYGGHCIGSAGLDVYADQHCATYSVVLFVGELRGWGLGREVTRLVLSWAFDVLGVHRVQLEVLASNTRAINCYLACGFHQEGVLHDVELYPGGYKDLIMMGQSRSEHA
jgi:[ribosomal protein S5]-alanine N-acetyltransferase